MTQKWGKEWSFYQRCGFELQHDTTKLWYVPEIYRNMVVDCCRCTESGQRCWFRRKKRGEFLQQLLRGKAEAEESHALDIAHQLGFPQMGDPQKRLVSNGNRKSYLNGRFRGTPISGNSTCHVASSSEIPLGGKILKDLLLVSNIVNGHPQTSLLIEKGLPALFCCQQILKTHLSWNVKKCLHVDRRVLRRSLLEPLWIVSEYLTSQHLQRVTSTWRLDPKCIAHQTNINQL